MKRNERNIVDLVVRFVGLLSLLTTAAIVGLALCSKVSDWLRKKPIDTIVFDTESETTASKIVSVEEFDAMWDSLKDGKQVEGDDNSSADHSSPSARAGGDPEGPGW